MDIVGGLQYDEVVGVGGPDVPHGLSPADAQHHLWSSLLRLCCYASLYSLISGNIILLHLLHLLLHLLLLLLHFLHLLLHLHQ